MIRIGANPIGWSNDDMPELGGETPLETCLAEAAAIGFEGMELGHKFPREARALRPILEGFGLDLVSGWYSTFLAERDAEAEWQAARPHAALLKAMGCQVFIAAECTRTVHGDRSAPLSRRPRLSDAEWGRFAARLTRFAERLRDEDGLILAYHHHMGTAVETPDEIDRLMRDSGAAVHLLLDTGHVTWGGGDPAAVARAHRHRIAHVHAKDVRRAVMEAARAADRSFLDSVVGGVYTVPGDGMVDFPAVFAELSGYAGWVVIEAEQDPAKAEPKVYAKMGYDHLGRVLKEAGFSRAA